MDPKNTNLDKTTNQTPNTTIPADSNNSPANSLGQITPIQTPIPTPSVQQPPTPPVKPKKNSKKLFLIPFLIILFLLLSTSIPLAMAYNNYKILTPPKSIQNIIDEFITISPLPKTTRIILAKTENTMKGIKSAVIENTFNLETDSKTSQIKSATLTLLGPVDFKSQDNSKVSLEVSASVAMDGIQLSGSGSLRKIKNDVYFKINEFPAASLLPIAQFKNQWFFINIDQFHGKKENETGRIFKDFQKVFTDFVNKSQTWTTKSTDKSQYILTLKPPKEEINNLFYGIYETTQKDIANQLEKNIQKDNLKKFTDSLENFQITAKIDKNSYLISEISLSTDFKIQAPATAKQSGAINLSPNNQIPINLKITSKFTKYNEPVIVEIPQGAKDLKETVNQLLKSLPKGQIPDNPFAQPSESTPQSKPKDQTGFKNFLENTSPVLGTQNTNWDKILMQYVSGS